MINDLISVITVSKNSGSTIASTIESVMNQSYTPIEYICIDGGSVDNTNEVISSYESKLSDRGILFKYISEHDEGIYHAMNKGIGMATGKWCIFLNSNDSFYDKDVLDRVFLQCKHADNIGCIYGNTLNNKDGSWYERKALAMNTIYYRAPFIHQALFVRGDILKKYQFDTRWKLHSEYYQFLKMYLDGVSFEYIDVIISKYDLEGVSQRKNIRLAIEKEKILQELGVNNICWFKRHIRNAFVILLKSNSMTYKAYIKGKRVLSMRSGDKK